MNSKKNIRAKKLSCAIATFNEEKNIRGCIQSIGQLASEIVVADGSSQDKTAKMAESLGATVIKTENKEMFHINKNLAIDNCHSEWVLLLDADERLSKDLRDEIRETISKNPMENAFYINRRNWFLGGFLKKGGAYPDSVIRLFRRGKGRLPEKSVHEQLAVAGEIGYLKNDLLHLADPDFTRFLERMKRYTDQTAINLENKDPGTKIYTIIYYLLIKPQFTFFSIFLRHKGFQDGFRGFIWALFSASHHFYAYVKYWHKKQKISVKN